MPRYMAGVLSTAGSTTLPLAALVGGTATQLSLVEVGIFNTTATSCNVKLCRISTAGTPGSSATSAQFDPRSSAATGVVKGTYTSTAPTTTDAGYRATLGDAKGSGVIWSFGTTQFGPIIIDNVASAAVGVLIESGTGQACEIYFVWDE